MYRYPRDLSTLKNSTYVGVQCALIRIHVYYQNVVYEVICVMVYT